MAHLNIDNGVHMPAGKAMEKNDFIKAIEKLRSEMGPNCGLDLPPNRARIFALRLRCQMFGA